MGVNGLWSLLDDAKTVVCLSDCQGKTLAVDLSAWIVECGNVFTKSSLTKNYLAFRGVFFRMLNLLSQGITLVFVLDGPQSPVLKKCKKRREGFYEHSLQFKELLHSMGLLVLVSDGEAEKLCAELNRRNVVDGVLTNDGDSLIYGATTIYKGLYAEKKDQKAYKYQISDTGLSHRDLVAFALLSGSDVSDGVPKVGEKKIVELFKELKQNNVDDILNRIQSWSSNYDLASLNTVWTSLDILAGSKGKHCSKCGHEGSMPLHSKGGCLQCGTQLLCKELTSKGEGATQSIPCPCQYHAAEHQVKPHAVELKVRGMALGHNPSFPKQELIDEYLNHNQAIDENINTKLRLPDYIRVCEILKQKLNMQFHESMGHLVPASIKMAVQGMMPFSTPVPLHIVRQSKENFQQCFVVKWEKLDVEAFSTVQDSCYEFSILADTFSSKFPEMATAFLATISEKKKTQTYQKKRKMTEAMLQPGQKKMTDMFNIVKKP